MIAQIFDDATTKRGCVGSGGYCGRMCNDTSPTPRDCQRALADRPSSPRSPIAVALDWQHHCKWGRRAAARVVTPAVGSLRRGPLIGKLIPAVSVRSVDKAGA